MDRSLYSKGFSEETKCIEIKNHPFSGNQDINKTNKFRIRKCVRIIYIFQSFLYANIPAESLMSPFSFVNVFRKLLLFPLGKGWGPSFAET